MTQDATPSTEVNNVPLCEWCAGMQKNWRRARGHPKLMQGALRSVAHKQGQPSLGLVGGAAINPLMSQIEV